MTQDDEPQNGTAIPIGNSTGYPAAGKQEYRYLSGSCYTTPKERDEMLCENVLGWTRTNIGPDVWHAGKAGYQHIPDFEHDIAAAMSLLEVWSKRGSYELKPVRCQGTWGVMCTLYKGPLPMVCVYNDPAEPGSTTRQIAGAITDAIWAVRNAGCFDKPNKEPKDDEC